MTITLALPTPRQPLPDLSVWDEPITHLWDAETAMFTGDLDDELAREDDGRSDNLPDDADLIDADAVVAGVNRTLGLLAEYNEHMDRFDVAMARLDYAMAGE